MNKIIPASILSLFLAGCAANTPAPSTPSQVATDLSGVLTGLGVVEKLIVAQAPTALSLDQQNQINSDLAQAQIALGDLKTGAGSSTSPIIGFLKDAEAVATTVVNDVPGLEAFIPAVEAAEAIINQYAPVVISLTAARTPVAKMSVSQARVILHIPTVSH